MFDSDLVSGVAFLAAGIVPFRLFRFLRNRNIQFENSTIVEGTIIALQKTRHGAFPTIEFERSNKRIQFRNHSSIHGAEIGQLIDIQLTPDGEARVSQSDNAFVPYVALILAIIVSIVGVFLIIKEL